MKEAAKSSLLLQMAVHYSLHVDYSDHVLVYMFVKYNELLQENCCVSRGDAFGRNIFFKNACRRTTGLWFWSITWCFSYIFFIMAMRICGRSFLITSGGGTVCGLLLHCLL